MPQVDAGWAVRGKQSDDHDDYRIISSSEWPLASAGFEQLIAPFSPGEPPRRTESPEANSFPWVVFSRLRIEDTPYLGIATTQWSDSGVDSTQRPIVETRYCCVRGTEGAALGFGELYRAVQRLRPTGDDGSAGLPLVVDVPDVQPGRRTALIERFGFRLVAEAAAALLSHAKQGVVISPEGLASLDDRIDFLDAVAGLLPSGGSWLTGATWWDHQDRPRNRVMLTFSTRPGATAHVVGRPVAQAPEARSYQEDLVTLIEKFGIQRVVDHLAVQGNGRKPDAAEAGELLRDLDAPAMVAAAARRRTLSFGQWLRLRSGGRHRELTSDDDTAVLETLAERATADQLTELSDLWRAEHYALLISITRGRLWRDRWDAAQLDHLLQVGRRFTDDGGLIAAVCLRPTGTQPDRAAMATAVQLIIELDPISCGDPIRDLLVHDRDLALQVVLATSSDPARARGWLRNTRYDEHGTTLSSQSQALTAMAFALGERAELRSTQLDGLLDVLGADMLLKWLQLSRLNQPPARVDDALARLVLPRLLGRAPEMEPAEVQIWVSELNVLKDVQDPLVAANRDFLLASWNQPPGDAATAPWNHDRGRRDHYMREFAALLQSLAQPARREAVLQNWTDGLPGRWAHHPDVRKAVLDVLWHLTHPTQSTPLLTDRILAAVATAVMAEPGWKTTTPKNWTKEFRQSRKLIVRVVREELVDLAPDAPVQAIADPCLQLLGQVDGAPALLADIFRDSRLIFQPSRTAALAELLISSTQNESRIDAVRFMDALVRELDRQSGAEIHRRELREFTLKRLRTATFLLRTVALDPQDVPAEAAEDLVRLLRFDEQLLREVMEGVIGARRRGRGRFLGGFL